MNIDKDDTAVVLIDTQNEVLSENGLAWPLVHESLRENNTIENMERIFKAAKALGFEVFIFPHYFYPTYKGWKSTDRWKPMKPPLGCSRVKES
jgi:nicotinamidase-related amidase